MNIRHTLELTAVGVLLVSPVIGHHSTAVNFNRNSMISLEGVVVEYKFQNPHVQISLEVENDAGETEVWLVEAVAKNQFVRLGWTGDEFKLGQVITVSGAEGYRPRTMLLMRAIMPDGSEIDATPRLPDG